MKRPRILIADDREDNALIVSAALASHPYVVEIVLNPADVKNRVEAFSPNLVILDIRMPEIDGLTLLHDIRKDNPYMPVIMMSAYNDIPSAIQSMKLGAIDYLEKPFSMDVLREKVRATLEQTGHDIKSLEQLEKEHIKQVLLKTGGHRENASEILGISLRTLYNKIKQYDL